MSDPHGKDHARYFLIGGVPFRAYTGTGTFTSLRLVSAGDSIEEMRQLYSDYYDECGGLLLVVDAYTCEPVDIGVE